MGIRVSWSFFVVYFVVIFFFFCCIRASTVVVGNETDRVALLGFKSKITHDPLGALASWNKSIHFCQWHGVTCSRRHQRVTILNLMSHKLAGSISTYIGNLSFLKVLNLQNNSFTHEIPSQIGRLQRLETLALNNNSIGGEIPANISRCSNLTGFSLLNNQLVGQIPSEFGSLSKIEELSLDINYLTGSIPSSLGNLSSIRFFGITMNNLTGSIPDTFCWLKNLAQLSLGANRLSGTIPSSIFNISSIAVFDVGGNQIQGEIPVDFGFTLPNLQIFSVAENQMTGVIPPSISNASNLEIFQAIGNKLTGEVPYLEKLQRLSRFIITSNSLGSGGHHDLNFMCSLTNASSLNILAINANNFGGLIPGCVSNISTTLIRLDLDNNEISGSIPTGIGKFVNLQILKMWNNQLSEYGLGSEASTNGDIYSYGILLLELVTIKKPTDNMFGGDMNLHNFVRTAMPEHVMDIIDLILLNDDEDLAIIGNQRQRQVRINQKIECLIAMMRIGVACSMESPQDRMNITNVVHELQSIKNTFLEPKTVFNVQGGQHS